MRNTFILLLKNVRLILLFTIIIVAALFNQSPLQNFINVITLQAPYVLIYSFGMTIVVLTGGLDLSQGATAAFSSCIASYLLIQGNIVQGVFVGLAIGACIGMLNGLLITKAKVQPFITTYGMDWIVRGSIYIIMNGAMIFGFPKSFKRISEGSIFGLSNLFFIALGIFVLLVLLLTKTVYGRNIYMMGSNSKATFLTGINTDFTIITVYMISGLLAAVAGLLYVSRLDCAEAFLGKNFGMIALSATLIGGTSLKGGKGGVTNTVVGALIVVFLMNCLNILKVSNLWHNFAFGLVILFSALMEKVREKYIQV